MKERLKIFIGGIERSGTTFLATSLARQVIATVIPEAHFKETLCTPTRSIQANLADLVDNFRFKLWEQDLEELVAQSGLGMPPFEALVAILERHLLGINHIHPVIDHTPDNISRAEKLEPLLGAAGYVYVYRDPRATILSIMGTDWGFPNLRAAIDFWVRRYEEDVVGLAFLKQRCPEKLSFVKYEDVCDEPFQALHPIKEKLEVPLNMGGKSIVIVPNYTKNQHRRLLGIPKSNENWREYFSEDELNYIKSSVQHSFFASEYFDRQISSYDEPRLGVKDQLRALRKPFDRMKAYRRRLRRGFQVQTV